MSLVNIEIVVTKQAELVQYLKDKGIVGISDDTQIMEHATRADVAGKHVLGYLPYHIAAVAESVTVIPIRAPVYLRGKTLTRNQIERYAISPKRYIIREQ